MADGDPNPGFTPGNEGNPNPGEGVIINAALLGDLKDDPVFKPFDGKPVYEVFKSFKNAQSMIGGEKVPVPAGKLNTTENWNYVLDKLGRPKSADGYKLEANLPDGFPKDEKLTEGFKKAAHYLGLLPWQAEGLFKFYNDAQVQAFQNIEAQWAKQAAETESALIAKLGTKQKYDEYVKGAQAALKRFGGDPQTVQAFVDKFGNDPLVVEVFGNVARGMMEDAVLRGDKNFDLFGEDAASKAKDIMSNPENALYKAYHDNAHPQHHHVVDEVYRLMSAIHGDKKVTV
mgnify:CR=1 FL=1